MARPITFLSDYGLGDEFVGVVHAVIAKLAPESRVIDLSHGIPRHGVLQGALVLQRSLPYAPAGVHLAVVDPEVGAERRALALRTTEEDRILVGPDNGLLSLAAQRFGGIAEVVDVARSPHRLEPVSATFHGRDIFAPVGAHLANGVPLERVGPAIDPGTLVDLTLPQARVGDGVLETAVLLIDSFGNARLAGQPADLARSAGGELEPGRRFRVRGGSIPAGGCDVSWHRAFGEVAPGEALLYEDADYGGLGISVNQASAAERFGLTIDTPLRIEATP